MRGCEYRAALRVGVDLELGGLTQSICLYGTGFGREGDGWRRHWGANSGRSGLRGGRSCLTSHFSLCKVSSGKSIQRRSLHDCIPASASWTPLAPSNREWGNGPPSNTCRRKSSHWVLNALSNVWLSGTSLQSAKKSWESGRSGFQTAKGVQTRGCTLHWRNPATALPWVPST